MIVSEDIFVLLLTHEKFKTFTPNTICDATKIGVLILRQKLEGRAKGVLEQSHGNNLQQEPQDLRIINMDMGFQGPGMGHILGIDVHGT